MSNQKGVWAESEAEIVHEEIIIHGTVMRKINGWRGEARIAGLIKIDGEMYEFNQVVSLRLKPSEDD